MRAAWILAAVALGGCSIVWAPNRDAIAPDLDGGLDGSIDAAMDAGEAGFDGGDGGDGGGCIPTGLPERNACAGGVDDDCDGYVDCFDSDCSDAPACCGSAGREWLPSGYTSAAWTQIPTTTSGDVDATDGTAIEGFGASGEPRALLYRDECAPIALGLDLLVQLEIEPSCDSACEDFAAIALAPTDDMVEGNRLLSEVALVVDGDGGAWIERAGTVLERTRRTGLAPNVPIRAELRLRPGVDPEDRAVMLATVTLRQTDWPGSSTPLLENEPLLIQTDLRGEGFCPEPYGGVRGLLLAIEGQGDRVNVVSQVTGNQRQCSNPSFFEELGLQGFELAFAECGGDQLGEPALVSYGTGPDTTWELWADTTDGERADNLGSFTDFYVCGARSTRLSGPWSPRTDGMNRDADPEDDPPVLPTPAPYSVREPFVWTPDEVGTGDELVVAWAQRTGDRTDQHAIYVGTIFNGADEDHPIGAATELLHPSALTECDSLRDPALIARGADPLDDGFYLLFTCEGADAEPSSIGVARIDGGDSFTVDEGSVRTDVLTSALGGYAFRGPFSPEPLGAIDDADGSLRVELWFLARSGGGEVTMSFASGEGDLADGFPDLTPYPANPVLRADDPILGTTPGCALGCSINGVGVTRAPGDFQVVVGRSVSEPSATTHQLIGLRQRRPL